MQFEYGHSFGLPRKIVWKYLQDASILKNSIPSCKDFKETSNGTYKGKMDINIGPIKDVFEFEIRRLKEKSPVYIQLGLKAKGKLGQLEAKADLFLKEGKGSTKLSQVTEANVTSAIAAASERMLENGAKKHLEKFFEEAEREMRRSIHRQKRGERN